MISRTNPSSPTQDTPLAYPTLGAILESMSVRPILKYPDPKLRDVGQRVDDFGPEFQRLVEDMAETMYQAKGIGLAAPQIGVPLLLYVIHIHSDSEWENEEDHVAQGEHLTDSGLLIFANPEFTATEGKLLFEEGCLSFPEIRVEVERSERVTVKAQDRHGKTFHMDADGLLAIALQHEDDHIRGKLFIDRVSPLKRRVIHRTMTKRSGRAA